MQSKSESVNLKPEHRREAGMGISSSSRGLSWAGSLALLILPWAAEAHTGGANASGWMHGLFHPFSGLDHLLVMIAVGLWAVQMGGKAVWGIPLTFVSLMALGGMLGMAALPLPYVESGIAMSVLVLGVLVAVAIRLPLPAAASIVGVFALFHGNAHGLEMPTGVTGLGYGLGFMLATAALHATGIALARHAHHAGAVAALRYAGGAISGCGLYLWFAA